LSVAKNRGGIGNGLPQWVSPVPRWRGQPSRDYRRFAIFPAELCLHSHIICRMH